MAHQIKSAMEEAAINTGKRAKRPEDIRGLLEDELYECGVELHGLFDYLLCIAEESFRKTQETRKKNNARSRARHAALSSCGLRRNRDGSYE